MKAWTLVTTRGVRAARLMHKVPGRPESAPTLAWLSSRRAHPPERGTSVSSDRDEGPLPDLLQTPGAAAEPLADGRAPQAVGGSDPSVGSSFSSVGS